MHYLFAITTLFLPAHVLRLSIANLKTNLLMLWIFLIWLVFITNIVKKQKWDGLKTIFKNFHKKILGLITLFFISGVIALFWKGFTMEKLGQFLILFVQPISVFFILVTEQDYNTKLKNFLISSFYLFLSLIGLFSIVQYTTLLGLPSEYWGNTIEPKRALGIYSHPNFYALFTAPLLAFLIPDTFLAFSNFFSKNRQIITLTKPVCWTIGAVGLFLSLSRAGWLGLGVAGLVYLVVAANKLTRKFALLTIIITIFLIIITPNLRWRITLPFYGEKSAVSRLSLWESGWKGVKESPIFGLGLSGFSKNWKSINTDPNIDTHNYPHNIFLNFWLETGLMGLISFIGLVCLLVYRGFTNKKNYFQLGIALFLIAFVIQGLFDNPYFKNDLSLLFWIIISL